MIYTKDVEDQWSSVFSARVLLLLQRSQGRVLRVDLLGLVLAQPLQPRDLGALPGQQLLRRRIRRGASPATHITAQHINIEHPTLLFPALPCPIPYLAAAAVVVERRPPCMVAVVVVCAAAACCAADRAACWVFFRRCSSERSASSSWSSEEDFSSTTCAGPTGRTDIQTYIHR